MTAAQSVRDSSCRSMAMMAIVSAAIAASAACAPQRVPAKPSAAARTAPKQRTAMGCMPIIVSCLRSRPLRRKHADDRARDLPSARVAPCNELPQCFAQAAQVRQPGLHDRKLSSRELTGLPATAPVFQREQVRNFRQREAEILGPLY